jgi:hypothetical protein
MVSLERDPDLYKRCTFNRPYDFIGVENKTVADFLGGDQYKGRTIYWIDYDDGISPDITADIISLGAKVKVGGFAFVTTSATPPGVLSKQNKEQRLEYFAHNFGPFSIGLTPNDMENTAFASTVHRVLVAAFENAFSARTDGKFLPLFQVSYRDTMPMLTVGGCFCEETAAAQVLNRVKADLPFLIAEQPYAISNLNLTERERVLFDMAVTRKRLNSKQRNALNELGFKKSDFKAYNDLIRFLPRYHESII